jgi:hypothetical protein
MTRKGKELEFISWIKRDGSGTQMVKKSLIKLLQEDTLELHCLSLTQKTFIAHGFNSFVVRLKPEPEVLPERIYKVESSIKIK